ncbi:hypothetical protein [Streptomyces sp. NPDC010273]|uniref:hypothetical protein n=1 Tax=Streptomyces sp. NPDC010273 TaxID=3364829 RepID=UPI0036EDE845
MRGAGPPCHADSLITIPLVFTLSRPALHTLSVGMFSFIGQNSTAWTLVCAGAVKQ